MEVLLLLASEWEPALSSIGRLCCGWVFRVLFSLVAFRTKQQQIKKKHTIHDWLSWIIWESAFHWTQTAVINSDWKWWIHKQWKALSKMVVAVRSRKCFICLFSFCFYAQFNWTNWNDKSMKFCSLWPTKMICLLVCVAITIVNELNFCSALCCTVHCWTYNTTNLVEIVDSFNCECLVSSRSWFANLYTQLKEEGYV